MCVSGRDQAFRVRPPFTAAFSACLVALYRKRLQQHGLQRRSLSHVASHERGDQRGISRLDVRTGRWLQHPSRVVRLLEPQPAAIARVLLRWRDRLHRHANPIRLPGGLRPNRGRRHVRSPCRLQLDLPLRRWVAIESPAIATVAAAIRPTLHVHRRLLLLHLCHGAGHGALRSGHRPKPGHAHHRRYERQLDP